MTKKERVHMKLLQDLELFDYDCFHEIVYNESGEKNFLFYQFRPFEHFIKTPVLYESKFDNRTILTSLKVKFEGHFKFL